MDRGAQVSPATPPPEYDGPRGASVVEQTQLDPTGKHRKRESMFSYHESEAGMANLKEMQDIGNDMAGRVHLNMTPGMSTGIMYSKSTKPWTSKDTKNAKDMHNKGEDALSMKIKAINEAHSSLMSNMMQR